MSDSSIVLPGVAVFATHEPRPVEVGRDESGRPRRALLGAVVLDLGQLARNSNDAAGGPVPVRIRHPGPGYAPPVVGVAHRFRVARGPGGYRLLSDLELGSRHLAAIRDHPRLSIERARWDDRRRQHVAAVALVDGQPGGMLGPLLDLPALRLPGS